MTRRPVRLAAGLRARYPDRVLRAISNPPNPWRSSEVEYLEEVPEARLEVMEDRARTILSVNDEAKVGFTYGLNPYRGCVHACAYCEARRRHELLGFGAGTDFDTKIVVKTQAPELLRQAFEARTWRGDVVVLSGATDAYQPLEASYRLTRRCLEVCAEYRNPVAIVTKGALIERDLDVLRRLRDVARVTVSISIPFWSQEVARALEPFVPTPARRMRTVSRLAEAGVDVGVSVAPMVLGLSEERLAELLVQAKQAGASRAVMSFLRLPRPVDAVFAERLRASLPGYSEGVLARVGDCGPQAQVTERLFLSTCRRLGLGCAPAGDDRANTPAAGPPETRTFRRPSAQGTLF